MAEDMDLHSVNDAMGKIEAIYRQPSGNIDLMKLVENKNLYGTWRVLRERLRCLRKNGKKS